MENELEPQWTDPGELEKFLLDARAMIILKANKTKLEEQESELKKGLMAILERLGQPYGSDGQHRAITLPTPIRGIVRLIRQSKVVTSVDEIKAEAIARDTGLYDELFKPVMTLDQDAVFMARERGLLTDADLEKMFPKKHIYSFVLEKKK